MGEEFGGFHGVRAPDFTTFTQRAPIHLPECPLFSTQGPSFRHRKLADTILKGPKSVSQSGPPPSPNNGPAFLCPFYKDTPQSVSINKLSFISGTSLIIFLNAVSGFFGTNIIASWGLIQLSGVVHFTGTFIISLYTWAVIGVFFAGVLSAPLRLCGSHSLLTTPSDVLVSLRAFEVQPSLAEVYSIPF